MKFVLFDAVEPQTARIIIETDFGYCKQIQFHRYFNYKKEKNGDRSDRMEWNKTKRKTQRNWTEGKNEIKNR